MIEIKITCRQTGNISRLDALHVIQGDLKERILAISRQCAIIKRDDSQTTGR